MVITAERNGHPANRFGTIALLVSVLSKAAVALP